MLATIIHQNILINWTCHLSWLKLVEHTTQFNLVHAWSMEAYIILRHWLLSVWKVDETNSACIGRGILYIIMTSNLIYSIIPSLFELKDGQHTSCIVVTLEYCSFQFFVWFLVCWLECLYTGPDNSWVATLVLAYNYNLQQLVFNKNRTVCKRQ